MSRLVYDSTIVDEYGIWAVDLTSKNGEDIHQTLAPWIGALCGFYLHEIRKLIAPVVEGRNDKVWWMSRYGRSLHVTVIQENIPRYIATHYGARLSVHKLRALEASFARIEFHEDAGVGSMFLRHKTLRASEPYVSQTALDAAKKRLVALPFMDTLEAIDFDAP